MKDLLETIQTRLESQVAGLTVGLVPAETYLPNEALLPFAGLKDLSLKRRDLAGGVVEDTLTVRVLVYAENKRSPADLARAGLDAAAAVDGALKGWTPSGYILGGDLAAFSAAQVQRDENGPYIQQVALDYQYLREVG